MFLAAALNPQRYHGSNIRRQFQRPNQVLRWGAGGERGYTQGECYRGGGGGVVRRGAALRGVKPATAFVLSEESWLYILSDRDRAFPSLKTALLRVKSRTPRPLSLLRKRGASVQVHGAGAARMPPRQQRGAGRVVQGQQQRHGQRRCQLVSESAFLGACCFPFACCPHTATRSGWSLDCRGLFRLHGQSCLAILSADLLSFAQLPQRRIALHDREGMSCC